MIPESAILQAGGGSQARYIARHRFAVHQLCSPSPSCCYKFVTAATTPRSIRRKMKDAARHQPANGNLHRLLGLTFAR